MGDDFVRVAAQGIVSLPDASVTAAKIADGVITPIKLTGGYTDTAVNYGASINDRVIDATGTTAVTLPTSVGNVGRQYIIRNNGAATVTIATTGGQLIDGSATLALAGKGFAEVIADGSGWHVLRAQYADETIGRRMFNWNHAYSTGGGWQMTYSDTGIRDMNSVYSPTNGWAIYNNYARLRRVGHVVECTLDLNGATATNALVQTNMIPTGFRPTTNQYFPGAYNSSGGAVRLMEITTAGTVSVLSYGSSYMYNQVTWTTQESWPASLPGSAVGTIPQ